jgi:tight adherence protein C
MNYAVFIGLFALFVVISTATYYVLVQGLPSVHRHIRSVRLLLAVNDRVDLGRRQISDVLLQLGRKATAWVEGFTGAALADRRRELMQETALLCKRAGFYDGTTPLRLISSRLIGLVSFPLLGIAALLLSGVDLDGMIWILAATSFAALGLYLPVLFLRWRMHLRQQRIARHFPDALDLIMICVEAGLGLDAAIQRVGDEFKKSCLPLHQEFRSLSLELRSGVLRTIAFQNLAARIDLRDVTNVVTTLTQADRLGTSLSEALKVQTEQLRLHRRLRAEERAAKIGTKLLFPLVFFLFPALFLVLVGPAVLSVLENFPGVGAR